MKKFLALIIACMTVASSFAAIEFSSKSFIGDASTPGAAPVLLKGKLKADAWMLDSGKCAVVKEKSTFDAYLAFCQPCINCVECEHVINLSYATLYIIEKDTKAKKVYITKLGFDDSLQPTVTTGGKTEQHAKNAKKGDVVLEFKDLPEQDEFGEINDVALLGGWNLKTWFTGNDTDSNGAKVKAIMAIVQKLDGNVASSDDDFWAYGTLNLRRDDSFTKRMMLAMTRNSSGSATSNPFLDCGSTPPSLDDCEDVMTTVSSDGEYVGYTMVEAYILKKSVRKGYKFSIDSND